MTLLARVDARQREIAAWLKRDGCSVDYIHMLGRGRPDLMVGRAGMTFLLEVKADDGELTPAEEKWHAEWRGHVAIVRTLAQARRAVGLLP